jgi:DNA-binding response OmpR family regulator
VLDLGLPDIPGEEICARLRQTGDVAIIMLTAKTSEDDRIMGLELGADDFVHKPYSPRELVSRVKAVLRRTGANGGSGASSVLAFEGGLKIDPIRHEATLDGVALPLTPAEYKLLHALASHAGRAFSRLELVEHITGDDYAGYERTIDAHVKNLRRKLGSGPVDGQWIETVRGIGYRLGARRQ